MKPVGALQRKLEQATGGFGDLPKCEVTAESSRLCAGRQQTGAKSALINTSMHSLFIKESFFFIKMEK